jgi:hypothetical protein
VADLSNSDNGLKEFNNNKEANLILSALL